MSEGTQGNDQVEPSKTKYVYASLETGYEAALEVIQMLRAEIAELKEDVGEDTLKYRSLLADRDIMREALANYSDPDFWEWMGDGYTWNGGLLDYRAPPYEVAKRARESSLAAFPIQTLT